MARHRWAPWRDGTRNAPSERLGLETGLARVPGVSLSRDEVEIEGGRWSAAQRARLCVDVFDRSRALKATRLFAF